MPDWKKVIVGDAFKLNTRDPRYYTNVFLFWPTLLFGILFGSTVYKWPLTMVNWRAALVLAFLLCGFIALLKERIAVVIGLFLAVPYMYLRRAVPPRLDAVGLGIILFCLAGALLLYLPNRARLARSEANNYPDEMDFLALCCGVGGIVFALAIIFVISHWVTL